MQPKLFTLTVLALSLGLVPALRAQTEINAASSIHEIEGAVDASIAGMKTAIDPVSDADYFRTLTKVTDIWINKTQTDVGGCHIKSRVQSAVDEMVARASRAGLHFLEVEQFQEQVIEARLDVELDVLVVAMMNGRISPGQYERMSTLVQERADAALEDVEAPKVRARLQGALDDLFITARTAEERLNNFGRFYAQLVDTRLARALGWLQYHAALRQATRQELDRVQALLAERANAQKSALPKPCN